MDIYAAITNGKYKSKVRYPGTSPRKPKAFGLGYEEADEMALKVYNKKIDFHRISLTYYYNEQQKNHEHFKVDALEYCGLTGHPKANVAYNFAWEHGHSEGFHKVISWLEEVTKLFVD